ncbi:MAG: hypothetical protein ACM3MK_11495 [Chitinophagales bacterium]
MATQIGKYQQQMDQSWNHQGEKVLPKSLETTADSVVGVIGP